jgi:drug/metabolite transporter (DMT)-like permease
MPWLLISLATALTVATHDAVVKKWFGHLGAPEMLAFPMIYSLPIFFLAIAFVPVPELDSVFYATFIACLPLNGICLLLYMDALRQSPLSLTLPYLAFTPTFMIVTGFVFLGEVPTPMGMSGILMTCLGSYVLNITPGQYTLTDPIRAVFREKGAWTMMIVAFIFSFLAVIGKLGILHSSVLFFSIGFFCVFNPMMILLLLAAGKIRPATFFTMPGRGLAAGVLMFAHVLLHGWAISLTRAAYMISVKRLSVLFGVVYGGLWFGETHLRTRLAGTVLMVAGAAIIVLKG